MLLDFENFKIQMDLLYELFTKTYQINFPKNDNVSSDFEYEKIYSSVYKEKWHGFNYNRSLLNHFKFLELDPKYLLWDNNYTTMSDIERLEIITVLSKICKHTHSKQLLYAIKKNVSM